MFPFESSTVLLLRAMLIHLQRLLETGWNLAATMSSKSPLQNSAPDDRCWGLYLNPDSGERSTSWINPILADCADRRAWESAFFSLKQEGIASQNTILFFAHTNLDSKGTSATENDKIQYWWKFILEGLQMGQKIRDIVESRKEEECLNV